MSLRDAPIRQKLMTVNLLTSGVVLLLTCGSFISYEVTTLHKNAIQGSLTRARIIATNATSALASQNQDRAAEVLGALQPDRQIKAACIYDGTGKIFAVYPTNAAAGIFPAATGATGFRAGGLETFYPVIAAGRRLGTVYIHSDLSTLNDHYRVYAWLAAANITGSIIVAWLLSRALQRQISRPVLALAETADAISAHRDFSRRAQKFGNDELGLLTDAFNQMLVRIQEHAGELREENIKRRQAEAQVQQLNADLELRVAKRTAELEAANRELEAFSYSVSHDLRAPLRAVNGFAGIVLDDFGSQLPREGRQHLERIRDAGQRMGCLIDDLLAFSRLSRQHASRQTIDTVRLVQNVLEELKPQLEGRPIEIRVGHLPACTGDRVLLKQIWVNLVSNAVKYTRGRNPAIVEIGCQCEGGENVYFVRDNGAGFDMQYAGKLFGVFQRLHRAEEFEGTGVGLAIVQRLVHRHGGRVWAEGAVNVGATFRFTLEGANQHA